MFYLLDHVMPKYEFDELVFYRRHNGQKHLWCCKVFSVFIGEILP